MSKKVFTVRLEVVTEWCEKCGYEGFYSFTAHRQSCPQCGANLNRGPKVPYKEVRVSSGTGHYDFAHPTDVQWSYQFFGLPAGMKTSFVVNDEIERGDNPAELARNLKERIDKYIYNTDKGRIAAVVKWLTEHEEEHEEQRRQNRIVRLQYELAEAMFPNGSQEGNDENPIEAD